MSSLFTRPPADSLAEKLRPKTFSEIFGQEALKEGPGSWLRQVQSGQLMNLIFWGPPGSGKTSAAQCFSEVTEAKFIALQATDLTTQKIRELIEQAQYDRSAHQQKTLLFIDEIHRLTKIQQDGFLSALEKGDLYLIGATTENPFYELNRALLSRCFVVQFKPLNKSDLERIHQRALELFELSNPFLEPKALEYLFELSAGDARKFLNSLEVCYHFFLVHRDPLSVEQVTELLNQKRSAAVDRTYKSDLISALIKSVRGSDPDAALLYLAQALEVGEDPIYLARRLVILASEDIGNADPKALTLAMAATQACELVGMPEGRIPLGQLAVYLSCAPKSNSSYQGINRAIEYVKKNSPVQIPEILKLNTFGSEPVKEPYQTPQKSPKGWNDQNYRTPEHEKTKFYHSNSRGFEKTMDEYINWLRGPTNRQSNKLE